MRILKSRWMGGAIITAVVLFGLMFQNVNAQQWSKEKARQWYANQEWMSGANFVPSTAINQIEMWQEHTFDPATIDRELGYAADLGFNTMRVYLHYLVWARSAEGLKDRMEQYLSIADEHGIRTMFVLYDDVWGEDPNLGPQPEPVPGIHNSGWVQSPGTDQRLDKALYPVFEAYTKDIVNHFADDQRVVMWDLYNEPGNRKNPPKSTLPLLKKVFEWARAADPVQPITSGVWNWSDSFSELNKFQLTHSDINTFHSYDSLDVSKARVEELKSYNRPLICTEYMARTRGNTFQAHMPYFKKEDIGAINWGLVSGKSQTIYSWPWPRPASDEYWQQWHDNIRERYPLETDQTVPEPPVWFHDILRKDGTPYSQEEADLIRKLNGVN